MKNLSFKQYYESKQRLLLEATSVVKFKTVHDVYKYCKVPFSLEENKTYISFKPKDVIIVEWQRSGDNIIPLNIEINKQIYVPSWNDKKMKTWVETSTIQKFNL